MTVTTTTNGAPVDADGYALMLDGGQAITIPASGQVTFPAVTAGTHHVLLKGIAPNCTADWYSPRPVEVVAAESTAVVYSLRCAAPSPKSIVFSSSQDNIGRNIYRADPGFTSVERLTFFTTIGDDHPDLSRSGTRIVFIRAPGTLLQGPTSLPQLWTMDADGSHQARLTDDTTHYVEAPRWSPDGTHIVFVRWADTTTRQVVLMTADGRSEEVLFTGSTADSTAGWRPDWSPDGSAVAMGRWVGHVVGVHIIDIATRQAVDVALPGDSLSLFEPRWAPSGDRFVACVGRPRGVYCDIATVQSDGSNLTVLVPQVPSACCFAWSPDGNQILAVMFDANGYFDFYTVPATGGTLTDISNTPASHEFSPSWGP